LPLKNAKKVIKMRGNSKLSWCAIALLILTLILSSQPVSAGGEDALLGDVELIPVPASQGEGGPITIEANIPFYSGCCYPLYAYDVSAVLNLPSNVEIISGPTPAKYSKVEATAGGEPTWVKITWIVKSMVAGEYTIGVAVNTQNCGSSEGSAVISVTEGCVISIPEVYPEKPSTERDLYINVEAMSPIEGVYIEEATFYYVTKGSELSNIKAKNEILNLGKSKTQEGNPISMEPIPDKENFFSVKVPKQDSFSYLHYWIVATDNHGNKTTSPVYILKIEDMAYSNFILGLAIWTPMILLLITIIIIVLLMRHTKKVDSNAKGLLVLGTSRLSQKGIKTKFNVRRWNRRLYIGFGIFVTIGCAVFIWALTSDQLSEMLYIIGGGL
jgi:hypothetical protein